MGLAATYYTAGLLIQPPWLDRPSPIHASSAGFPLKDSN